MRHAWWNENTAVIVRAIGAFAEIDDLSFAIGRRTLSQVVQHHAAFAKRYVPIVGLMQVIMQTNETTSLAITTVRLNHFTTLRKPFTPVRLYEKSALIAVHGGFNNVHASNDVGGGNDCHVVPFENYSTSTVLSSPNMRRRADGR